VRGRTFLLVGAAVAVAIAVLVSPFASAEPDGLERVAIDEGFAADGRDHALAGGPTADYGVEGVDDDRLGTALAGLLGVAVTGAVATGLFLVVRRRAPA
jgi:cobalt/nickel transport system permease protein